MPDPPLEITWFYSAVTFHSSKSAGFSKTIVAKDLFQLLISCSCNGTKKIALLAPLIYVLHDIVCEFSRNGLCLTSEIRELVEKIVDYICLCLVVPENGSVIDEDIVCFEELAGVWMVDLVGKCAKLEENLGVFFPIVRVEVHKGQKSRRGIRDLAGIVMCEVFLLALSLKFNMRFVNEEFQKDARNWAIQTLKQFQNIEFLGEFLLVCIPLKRFKFYYLIMYHSSLFFCIPLKRFKFYYLIMYHSSLFFFPITVNM
uniref:Putative ovule protein n=1 Tax=Solanum chacoense TaxID=4108 RepID=A0A0V0HN74_SOLCH